MFANYATLGGHVELGDWVIMGGFSGVHQFCKVGAHAFIANNAAVTRDVPPYVMAAGQPAEPHASTPKGLKRRGFTREQIRNIRNAYRMLYRSDLKLAEATRAARASARATQPELRAVRRLPRTTPPAASCDERRALTAGAVALRIGLVAGEASGDTARRRADRSAARARAGRAVLRRRRAAMIAAGCEAWAAAEELAVMGLFEVLRHLPRLLRLRRDAARALARATRPDVFVGIDAPEFNLGLARAAEARGHPHRAVREPAGLGLAAGAGAHDRRAPSTSCCACCRSRREFYAQHGVRAEFVGHPLADQIPLRARSRRGARARSGSRATGAVVALLPGSRLGEVARLGADFSRRRAPGSQRARPELQFVAPMANAAARARRSRGSRCDARRRADGARCSTARRSRRWRPPMWCCVASGTATLETLLVKRPMVVAYRLGALTAFLLRDLGAGQGAVTSRSRTCSPARRSCRSSSRSR